MIPRLPDVKPPCLTAPETLSFRGFFCVRDLLWTRCGRRRKALAPNNRGESGGLAVSRTKVREQQTHMRTATDVSTSR